MRKGKYTSLIVALVGAAIVYGLFWFQYKSGNGSYDHYIVVNMLLLLWAPMLTIFGVFHADPSAFGFTSGFSRGIWWALGALFGGLLVLMVVAAPMREFQMYYPVFRRWTDSNFRAAFAGYPRTNPFFLAPMTMLYAEITYGTYLFCWEFFFRGYLLYGLQKSLGSIAAVILQAIAFGLLHWMKPEMIPSFGAGIILGILALRAKSFVPGFVLHWAASVGFDVLIVATRHHA